MKTEKDPKYYQKKLDAWYEDRKKNHGLVSIDFTFLPGTDGKIPTLEEACKEVYLALVLFEKEEKEGKIKPVNDNDINTWL